MLALKTPDSSGRVELLLIETDDSANSQQREFTSFNRSNVEVAVYCKISVTCLLIFACVSPLQAQLNNTQRGALSGGAAGAVIGGIIGNQNDETPEGALIGGAVGAIAGSLLGKQQDQAQYQQRVYQQQRAQVQAEQFANGVSINDVVTLSQHGVSETVIVDQIQKHGIQQKVGVNEIVFLHQQGVNNNVISVMQRAHFAGSAPAPAPVIHPGSGTYGVGPAIVDRPILTSPSIVINPRPVVVNPRPVVVARPPVVISRPPVVIKTKPAVVVSPRYGSPQYRHPRSAHGSPYGKRGYGPKPGSGSYYRR